MNTVLKLFILVVFGQYCASERATRWCVTNEEEEIKCNFMKLQMKTALENDQTLSDQLPEDFQCIRRYDQ
ncbi:hypothetical protein PoB_001749400 [Plakobranchus ocellatus]|uniref:Transferrin-like domain-containing protein n=1 Tax=Plakobranchus ocellatus TaxID=259542 RepID=A0AAV3Z6N9_9GAST|nr:hypothetical protein PoB_001749400 [Plakobranchus ocellatus]